MEGKCRKGQKGTGTEWNHRVEQSSAEKSGAEKSSIGHNRPDQGRVEQSRAEHARKQRWSEQSRATGNRVMQSKTERRNTSSRIDVACSNHDTKWGPEFDLGGATDLEFFMVVTCPAHHWTGHDHTIHSLPPSSSSSLGSLGILYSIFFFNLVLPDLPD